MSFIVSQETPMSGVSIMSRSLGNKLQVLHSFLAMLA